MSAEAQEVVILLSVTGNISWLLDNLFSNEPFSKFRHPFEQNHLPAGICSPCAGGVPGCERSICPGAGRGGDGFAWLLLLFIALSDCSWQKRVEKKPSALLIKPEASRLASLTNVSSIKRLIHSFCSGDT